MAEVENMAIEEARELVSNRLLWPLVRDFLWDFAPSIHESWIGGLEVWKFGRWEDGKFGSLDDVTSKLPNLETSKLRNLETSKLRDLQTSSRVKRHILSLLGVERCFHTFPKEDGSRLLLLDGATLESVVKWLGALACAGALRRVTDGATVRELKNTLHGVYPEVFGYTMYFGSLEVSKFGGLEGSKFGSLEVEKVGYGILLQSLSSLPAPLMYRLKLKLPKKMSTMEPPNLQTSKPPNFQTSKLPNLQTSIFKLLKLKFPEAYKLCCS